MTDVPHTVSFEEHCCRTLVETVSDVSGAGTEWRFSEQC